jgi:signal transduction histidine kinase
MMNHLDADKPAGPSMRMFEPWRKASIRTKVLIPFLVIFVVSMLLGTYYFLHVVLEMIESRIEDQLHTSANGITQELRQQERRMLHHAQNMVEIKLLADQTPDTNQARLLQIHELEDLRTGSIRFLGIYGKDLAAEDPLYPIVQKGLRGLRVTGLVRRNEPAGTSWHLVGVAPVPAPQWTVDVVLLETALDRSFLEALGKRFGANIVLYDRQGAAMADMDYQTVKTKAAGLHQWMQSTPPPLRADTHLLVPQVLNVGGTPYKALLAPFIVNYEVAGTIAVMIPVEEFLSTRTVVALQALAYALIIIVGMSLVYLLIVRGITVPLKALEKGAQRMMAGEPVEGIETRSGDEVGTLTRTFNEMSRSLQHREKELQVKAREFENKTKELNAILEHMADGVVVLNRDYRIEYMNRAAVDAFDQRVGEKCYNVFYGKDEPCHPCSIDEVLWKKQPVFQYRSADPRGKYYEVIAQPLHQVNGEDKVITIRRDITEQRLRTEQQQIMEKKIQEERLAAIQQVVVSIKHTLNNSLTAIFGSLELLEEKESRFSEKEQEIVSIIAAESEKIKSVVSKLSNIAQASVTRYTEDVTMIDLDDASL